MFGNVFEELLRPEVHRILPIWTWGGAASGAVLGFVSHQPSAVVLAAMRSTDPTIRVSYARRTGADLHAFSLSPEQITANLPGAAFGAFAGSKLGAIRDAKGKSVASVFSSLPQTEKAVSSCVAAAHGCEEHTEVQSGD